MDFRWDRNPSPWDLRFHIYPPAHHIPFVMFNLLAKKEVIQIKVYKSNKPNKDCAGKLESPQELMVKPPLTLKILTYT